jgi:ferredoxin
MDIKKVGDHECINCGECIKVCPTKAISWKGSQFFLKSDDINTPTPSEIKPLSSFLNQEKGTETIEIEVKKENVQEEAENE